MKSPNCPACGAKPTVHHINGRVWAHSCPRVSRTLWWDRTSFSPILQFLVLGA